MRLDEQAIFEAARKMETGAVRDAYLRQVCGDDAALGQRIRALLKAFEESASFLEAPASPLVCTVEEPPREGPGAAIGPYKLLEQIGEGGFGVVFMAEQHEPVRRKVALKVLKPGMDSKQVIARFEVERQALALMDHPNIAKVLDAGQTAGGRPYFVMDLVRGLPVTEFCDQGQLTAAERLELFVHVCEAVQHAHQKGIIHRDIKPSNVLVTLQDGAPLVKVIDFGIAKALGQQLTDKTLFTGFAQMIGTPLYMSPEQAGLSNGDADTRSDIYSLGVLLYELLTGTTPFDKERFKRAGYDEIRRIIREEEPARPSTRISTLGRAATTLSLHRRSDPKRLSQLLRGELDWVVMKALEKDRNRRYESASAFAADVQRYLHDEPVQAHPPSAVYRVQKFIRRQRVGLTMAAVVAVAVIAIGAGGWWSERRQALLTAKQETENRLREEEEGKQQAERLDAIRSDLGGALDHLRKGRWPDARLKEERIKTRIVAGDPEELHQGLKQVRVDLAMVVRLEDIRLAQSNIVKERSFDYAGADPAFGKAFRDYGIDVEALGVDEAARLVQASAIHLQLVDALDAWVLAKWKARDPRWEHVLAVARRADREPVRDRLREAFLRRDLKAYVDMAQKEDITVLTPLSVRLLADGLDLAWERPLAVEVLRQAQRRRPDEFWYNFSLGYYLNNLDPPQPAEAAGYSRVAIALNPRSTVAHFNLAAALARQNKFAEAVVEIQTVLELNPDFRMAHYYLGWLRMDQKRFVDAEEAFRGMLKLHPDAEAHVAIGAALYSQRKLPEAAAEFQAALKLQPDDAPTHTQLGTTYFDQRKFPEAEAEFREVFRIEDATARALSLSGVLVGATYRKLRQHAGAHANLANALAMQNKDAEALAEYQIAIQLQPNYAMAHYSLAVFLEKQGKVPEAEAEYRQAVACKPDYLEALENLGTLIFRKGKLSEAAVFYQSAVDQNLEGLKLETLFTLTNIRLEEGKFAQALETAKHGRIVGSRRPGWNDNPLNRLSAQMVGECERLVALDAKLTAYRAGKPQSATTTVERFQLAWLCRQPYKRLYGTATGLFIEAFTGDPKVADNLDAEHRYFAAGVAVLAGTGQGEDAKQFTEVDRIRWRKQALEWLGDDLKVYAAVAASGEATKLAAVNQRLQRWRKDSDLAAIREAAALDRLPGTEREAFMKLWAEVHELLRKTAKQE
jgi:serine/threonine protein kinase/tetratricopeptide (TPR) repeat protein